MSFYLRNSALIRENVVAEGLQMHLDASNRSSYPGTGNVWFNLAGGPNVSLSNTTFSQDSLGGISYTSSSSGANFASGLNFANGGFTISVWLRHSGTVSTARVQRYFSLNSSPAEGPVVRHNSSSNASLHGYIFDSGGTFRSIDLSNQIFTNTYYNVVYTYNGSVFRLYRNNVEVGSFLSPYHFRRQPPRQPGTTGNGMV
jgi:hypothetical protein